jgi:hypothetical protein
MHSNMLMTDLQICTNNQDGKQVGSYVLPLEEYSLHMCRTSFQIILSTEPYKLMSVL